MTAPLPVVESRSCAACGKSPVDRRTTFLCCNEERYLCAACWSRGENDEAWDMDTSNRIQLRDRKLARKKGPTK